MNATQKKFILSKLIPFISREHGRGFAMNQWLRTENPGVRISGDGISRKMPVCGTMACIGGSIDVLKKRDLEDYEAANILGLSEDQTKGLFYNWNNRGWPLKFKNQFKRAKTPYGKAMAAVRLLREIVKTEGKCLNAEG